MKQIRASLILAASLASSGAVLAQSGSAPNLSYFTGDTRLACEAILCLSSGQRPSECNPSLRKYFSLRKQNRKDKSTAQKRSEFLNLCPAASHDSNMVSLVNAIVHGAGNCDAKTLNATLIRMNKGGRSAGVTTAGYSQPETIISNAYPAHCSNYASHAYTDLGAQAKYVGIPERGGFWADPAEYDAKKAEYDKRIAAEDKARAEAERKGGSFGGSSSIGTGKNWERWSR